MLRKRKHHLKNKVKYTECREPMQEDKQPRSPLLRRIKQVQEYFKESGYACCGGVGACWACRRKIQRGRNTAPDKFRCWEERVANLLRTDRRTEDRADI